MKEVRRVDVGIIYTPQEVEKIIWDGDSEEQADILICMANRYYNEHTSVEMQLLNVAMELNEHTSAENREKVIRMLKTFMDFLEIKEEE